MTKNQQNCATCARGVTYEPVPFRVHENMRAQMESANRRLWIALILCICLLVVTNGLWVYYESQFTDIEITQENEDGYNNFIGNDGDINNYGKADSEDSRP